MQLSSEKLTRSDFAKYPFLKDASDYVKKLELKIHDLVNPSLTNLLERAEERINNAILYNMTGKRHRNDEIEILSFAVAIMLVVATDNNFIKKRYALAEAKQAYENMRSESREKILALAQNFNWKLTKSQLEKPCEFSLNFVDYVKNTAHLRDGKWKLVNRFLSDGNVYLTRSEVARLLSEEIRRYVEKRLEVRDSPTFPAKILEITERVKKFLSEKIGETEVEELPKTITQTAFPPCIDDLYQAFTSGRHLSHIGRFALTTFLVNIGMPSENLVELFKNVSDFNEKMTRYQVEHIAGEKGSRTRYSPPSCSTLKTHGVCVNADSLCQKIHHPLAYYRKKLKMNQMQTSSE